MFGWLKMSEICTSPFDGDDHYDLDVAKELEMEIWRASLALQEAVDDDEYEYFHVLTTLFQSTSFTNFTCKRPVIWTLPV